MAINKKYPKFRVEFQTEETSYSINYNTNDVSPTSELVESRVIQFESKNSMADDSAIFSVLLAADVYWDKLIDANDIIKVYINPDESDKNKYERLVAIGMVSQVTRQADYSSNQILYRVTGQSFAKPFMKFGLGIIQEVQSVLSEIGWLPDSDEDGGISFSGSNAEDIMSEVLDRFTPYMKYKFNNKSTLITDFFDWELESWNAYESLVDPNPFINFDGTLNQLLGEIAAKPFNELFFVNNPDVEGMGRMVLRKTPFNPSSWKNLDYVDISTNEVISEEVGKSDVETNSIFTVTSPKMFSELSKDVFSVPQYNQELVDRYGYSKLEVENRYLALGDSETSASDNDRDKDDKESETSKGTEYVYYSKITALFSNYDKKSASANKTKIVGQISGTYKNVSKKKAEKAVDTFIKKGEISRDDFQDVFNKSPDTEEKEDSREVATADNVRKYMEDKYPNSKDLTKKTKKKAINELTDKFKDGTTIKSGNLIKKYMSQKGNLQDKDYEQFAKALTDAGNLAKETNTDSNATPLKQFSIMLFNWYHMNSNFYSGEITIIGNPYIDLGQRMFILDKQDNDNWEFYIESVEHKFSYKEGYITVIGVTRGLKEASVPEGSPHRFKGLWNKSTDFKGGLMGEKQLGELKEAGYASMQSDGDKDSDDSDGAQDGGSLSKLKKYKGNLPKYDNSVAPGNRHYYRQCTWYVFNRRHQLGIDIPLWGDAAEWGSGAKASGYKTGKTPKQGAAVYWSRTDTGGSAQYGHVAFVEKVLDGGKSIKISEYNWIPPLAYAERTITMSSQVGKEAKFIYDK